MNIFVGMLAWFLEWRNKIVFHIYKNIKSFYFMRVNYKWNFAISENIQWYKPENSEHWFSYQCVDHSTYLCYETNYRWCGSFFGMLLDWYYSMLRWVKSFNLRHARLPYRSFFFTYQSHKPSISYTYIRGRMSRNIQYVSVISIKSSRMKWEDN